MVTAWQWKQVVGIGANKVAFLSRSGCVCGDVQSKRHVVEVCPHTQYLRNLHGFNTLHDLFSKFTDEVTCKVIYDILRTFS